MSVALNQQWVISKLYSDCAPCKTDHYVQYQPAFAENTNHTCTRTVILVGVQSYVCGYSHNVRLIISIAHRTMPASLSFASATIINWNLCSGLENGSTNSISVLQFRGVVIAGGCSIDSGRNCSPNYVSCGDGSGSYRWRSLDLARTKRDWD